MKNAFLFNCKTPLKNMTAMRILIIASLFLGNTQLDMLNAQAKLSIQGILKKATGEAVPDGSYDLTFKLYTVESGGTEVWDEIQNDVDVVNGIYSTVLGNDSLLTIPFNQIYYLGVKVGSTEMTPRVQLTSAPYALSLIGTTNTFPSSGIVKADSIRVAGGVLARGGAPGANGANKNGYAFIGNNGDKDSGLFCLGSNQVSLYANNAEEVKVTPDSVVINGEVRPQTIRLDPGGRVNYNGLDDWRLVETDYFDSDVEGWKIYDSWNDASGVAVTTLEDFDDDFAGKALVCDGLNKVFKKKFTLPGSTVPGTYTYVKVVFKYFYLDSWDLMAEEKGYAAFSKTEACTALSVGWLDDKAYAGFGHGLGTGPGSAFSQAANFHGATGGSAYSDQWTNEEMVGRYPSGVSNADFWVVFGAALNDSPESFGVGMIEIWVK